MVVCVVVCVSVHYCVLSADMRGGCCVCGVCEVCMVLVMLVDFGKMRVENVDYTIKVFLSIAKAWL